MLRAFVLSVALAPLTLLALNQARLHDIQKTTQEAAERIGLGVPADAHAANGDTSPRREDFRNALLATGSDSLARRLYQRVDGDGVRVRSAPSENSAVLSRTERDAYVRLEAQFAEGNWCRVRLAEGREGWMKCDFLRPVVSVHAPRWE
jgi:uncharacterized protein YgiM (DUF1202 family)